jgi:putative peptidoglycan lipid II flippase
MLLFVAVSQIGVIVVLAIAKRAGDHGAPGPAIFNYAFLIFMMAHGIVAVSIITALLPRMSTAAQEGRYSDLAEHLALGTRLSAVILVPTAAAYIVLGQPLAVTLFKWGNFHIEDARATGTVIVVTGVALVPYAISQLQVFAFYALSDTRTPALVNVPVVGLRLAIDVALYLLLPATAVVAGLMWGSTVSFVLGLVLGYWLLRRRIGPLGLAGVARTLSRLGVAAALGALPAAGVAWLLGHLLGTEKVGSFVQLTVGGMVLIVGYVAAGMVLRVPEIREVGHMLTGRLRRS